MIKNLPKEFDWKFYLDFYQDLRDAGLKTMDDAVHHYLKHGYQEERKINSFHEYRESTVNCPPEPKILTFYLPAFYPFLENNQFWGEGFTEWTNIRSWKPFYPGHQIKQSSLEFGQYDLRDLAVRKKHGELAKTSGIHGFVFYHYWFSTHPAKKVMHEVLEKMLEDGEPNVPFCLEWANEPWTKKWDGYEHEYLIKQEYGSIEDQRMHFDYLNKFFSHPNYIKVDEKPMFCIYRIGHISDFEKLKSNFNQFAIEAGYPGIHFVELLNSFNDANGKFNIHADAYAEYHPMYINWIGGFNETSVSTSRIGVINIEDKWKKITEIEPDPAKIQNKEYYRGMYAGWDASPRALNRHCVHDAFGDPAKFQKYLTLQLNRVKKDSFNPNNYLFLFAWNEWGEGAVLEPSDLTGSSYLEAVLDSLNDVKNK
jgi:hypothetical protein